MTIDRQGASGLGFVSEEKVPTFKDDDDILDAIDSRQGKDPFAAMSHYQYKA